MQTAGQTNNIQSTDNEKATVPVRTHPPLRDSQMTPISRRKHSTDQCNIYDFF